VRIFFGLALGVVLAVDGGPFLGHHAGGHPQPETEEVAGDRVQFERAMRLATMQVESHAHDGDVRHHQCVNDNLPTGRVQQAVGNKVEDRIKGHQYNSK
jgi:hypothetical protein